MNALIQGHSGCAVSVISKDNHLEIEKSTENINYFPRLRLQGEKQMHFNEICNLHGISSPKVFSIKNSDNKLIVNMEYIHSRNYITFFENSHFTVVGSFAKRIIEFLEWEIANSQLVDISSVIIKDKWNSVLNAINSNSNLKNDDKIKDLISLSSGIFNNSSGMHCPIGISHGDLTLSNILFQDEKIYLIDFLDSFIETPIMDIVKLRQDTKYFWSQQLAHGKYDMAKNRIALAEVDRLIVTWFEEKYPEWTNSYNELQLMNFWRILQYAKNPQIINYLKGIIEGLI